MLLVAPSTVDNLISSIICGYGMLAITNLNHRAVPIYIVDIVAL